MAESENKYIVVEDEEGELSIIHIKWMFSASDVSQYIYILFICKIKTLVFKICVYDIC